MKNEIITSISSITVIDKDGEWKQEDTFIIECNGVLFRILVDHVIELYELNSVENLPIKGDYDLRNGKIVITPEQTYNQRIDKIINYNNGPHYLFGSKFINPNGEYIFGFCYGLDEIIILDEVAFIEMVENYQNVTVTVI